MLCEVSLGREGAKLGWFRVNFNYFISDTVADYIIEAVHFMARHGHKLVALYRFDPFTGLWHHRSGRSQPPVSLYDVTYASGEMEFRARHTTAPESVLADQLEAAHRLVASLADELGDQTIENPVLPESYERMRWFPLPGEAHAELRAES